MSKQSQFVVDQLRPEGLGGGAGGVYQLTASSVSPSRIIGRDEVGMPIEDTVPAAYWRYMLDPAGNICKVPLRTAAVFSMEPEAERYEQQQIKELIGSGWIPMDLCPHSTEYTHITRGPFAKAPAGVEACDGKKSETGCEHMQKVTADRRLRSKAKHDAAQTKLTTMSTEEANRQLEQTTKAFGMALAQHMPDPSRQRQNLARGKGEE